MGRARIVRAATTARRYTPGNKEFAGRFSIGDATINAKRCLRIRICVSIMKDNKAAAWDRAASPRSCLGESDAHLSLVVFRSTASVSFLVSTVGRFEFELEMIGRGSFDRGLFGNGV